MDRNSRIHRWFGTSTRSDPAEGEGTHEVASTPPADLEAIRQAMLAAVAPCSEAHRLRTADLVGHAHTVVELWLIRADIFQYLAQDIGQMRAAQQVSTLLPLFTGMPGVAAVQKNPDNRGHDPRLH
ncbi:MAG: hypothetical protein V4625_01830 [Pseudomonadota bacterium]